MTRKQERAERSVDADLALRRLARYARATGVKFERGPRRSGWEALGLPDVRGFTPHLRRVGVGVDDDASRSRSADGDGVDWNLGFEELSVPQLWLLHDLAHVVWYDMASATFGPDCWCERDFFVEHHLASEAFAVLLLDYHVLSRTSRHGLAVELDVERWKELRRRVLELPVLDSATMCRDLVRQYHCGDSPLFHREFAPKPGVGVDAKDFATLSQWRDHEVSYSDKQRWYVLLWWDDLVGESTANMQAIVDGSTVAELVWLALRLFTRDTDAFFEAHVARVAKRVRTVKNYFSWLPKYRLARGRHDFRFTDVVALEPELVAELLRRADAPRAETLFLLWQVLALSRPERLSVGERNAVATLAKSAQTAMPDASAWKVVRSICERIVVEERWTPDARVRAAFFLP